MIRARHCNRKIVYVSDLGNRLFAYRCNVCGSVFKFVDKLVEQPVPLAGSYQPMQSSPRGTLKGNQVPYRTGD